MFRRQRVIDPYLIYQEHQKGGVDTGGQAWFLGQGPWVDESISLGQPTPHSNTARTNARPEEASASEGSQQQAKCQRRRRQFQRASFRRLPLSRPRPPVQSTTRQPVRWHAWYGRALHAVGAPFLVGNSSPGPPIPSSTRRGIRGGQWAETVTETIPPAVLGNQTGCALGPSGAKFPSPSRPGLLLLFRFLHYTTRPPRSLRYATLRPPCPEHGTGGTYPGRVRPPRYVPPGGALGLAWGDGQPAWWPCKGRGPAVTGIALRASSSAPPC